MQKDKFRSEKIFIYGKHALVEALTHAPDVVQKVFLSHQVDDEALRTMIKARGLTIHTLGDGGPSIERDAVHQGVVAQVNAAHLLHSYEDFITSLTVSDDTLLVVLDEVQDPQNVGAIIRSAAAFGAAGVLIPAHNQAQVTGAVVKVSAGMAFRIPLVSIGNVNQTVRDLKERGFWTYGLAGEGAQSMHTERFDRATAFIVGNESEGIRHKTRELCDILLSIPIHARCESLNAAASAAVALYAWSAQHPKALK